jgi:hypothetical protein
MRPATAGLIGLLLLIWAQATVPAAGAQERLVPVRPLGPIVASTTKDIPEVTGLRQLSDGRVLVFDQADARLLIFDSMLAVRAVVIDTVPPESRRVGFTFRHDALVGYRGDSTLQTVAGARTLVVLDPGGNPGRVFASPPVGIGALGDRQPLGGVDATGGLVYAGRPPPQFASTHFGGDSTRPIVGTDSAPILRQDLATGLTTLLGRVRIPTAARSVYATIQVQGIGRVVDVWCPIPILNPIEIHDDWALLSDGSVALIRASDAHIDWIGADGSRTASPSLVADRHRLSDNEKASLVDSMRTAQGRLSCPGLPAGQLGPFPQFVEPREIPNYRPVFVPGGSWPDADGDVWLERVPEPGSARGPIYDVVNRAHGLVQRVQLPLGYAIAGFGPGVVYLTEAKVGGVRLVKARIR